ncbi:unnamed protein product [Moneuplotes crassus]|uniref:CCAAT-binding factor domain-containing protein n=1 Tax=Euplotes crassus TaxID=5936 RepID=A0AAD1Y735_EUPCR|nr:unnamed protein product [Moneuplotes crassus]
MGKKKSKTKTLEKLEENIGKLETVLDKKSLKLHKKKKGKKKAVEYDQDGTEEYQAKAAKLIKEKERIFKEKIEKPSQNDKDAKWYKSLMDKGTVKDKIMALSMIVKKDPESSGEYLKNLIKQAYKKDRKQAFIALDSLQEVFCKALLPEDRKLKSFKQSIEEAQEKKTEITNALLTRAYHENIVRSLYIEYVDFLGKCTNDNLDYFKKLAISIVSDCLMSCPEREETLLSILINKLGDPNNDIPKHTIQNIIRILKKHGNMTAVFTGEIQQFMERVHNKSLYFFVSCLNKIVYYEDDTDYIADALKIYFSQFKRLFRGHETAHKNEVITLILRGIHNIVSNLDPGTLELTVQSISEEIGILFSLTRSNSFRVKIETLKLIFVFLKVQVSLKDKFYTTLYQVVGSLTNVAAIKLDSTFALLYKAIKKDTCIERVQAFFKRLIQMCYVNEISFVAASILLINEVLKSRKEIRGLMFSKDKLLDSDDEEVFVDVEEGNKKSKKNKKRQKKAQEKEKEEAEDKDKEENKTKFTTEYVPRKKDPRYANADQTSFWELDILRNYYHPTIRIWVKNMMSGREIKYNGDPLQDFSLGNFLDKIILKPAKSSQKLEKMRFRKKRTARAEEIKEIVKKTEDDIEDPDYNTVKSKIAKTSEYRPDEEFLYKHLLLKSKKEKQERQKALDHKNKKTPVEDQKDKEVDALNEGAEDFSMSDGELPEGFFEDEEDLNEVDVPQGPEFDEKIFQEAPSDIDDD